MKAVFNSLGSSYTVGFALKALVQGSNASHTKKLTEYLESRYSGKAHLFYKGREALQAALVLADLPKNSQVLITGYTCYAVYRAVIDAGCEPVFIDISPDTLNIEKEAVLKALVQHKNAQVLLVQNTLGYACDIEAMTKIAKDHNLVLIEDLAHCIGLQYSNGQEAGTVGDYAALSFSQDKVVDGISGGALIVRAKTSKAFRQVINYTKLPPSQQLRDRFYPATTLKIRTLYPYKIGKIIHVLSKKLHLLSKPVDGVFGTYRMLPHWYSALIHRQFTLLDESLSHRASIAEIYSSMIPKELQLKKPAAHTLFLRFPILVPENRDSLFAYLKKSHIHVTDIWYESPVAPLRYQASTSYKKGSCPESEKVSQQMVNLPTHIGISKSDAKKIAERVSTWQS